MANIRPRTNKEGKIISYEIRVYRGRDEMGKQLKPYVYTWKVPEGLTSKQMEKALKKQELQFEERCQNGGVANTNMKLAEFCPQYLDIMKNSLSPATLAFYVRVIEKHIIPSLGYLKLKDIKPTHIQSFIQTISNMPKSKRNGEKEAENISPATVRRYLTVLQSILKSAVKLGLIAETPARAEKLTLQKILEPKIEIFTKQEAAEMLACLEKEDLQFQVLIQLAIFMGARRGELVALKFSDVDYIHSKITIERAAIKLQGHETQIKPPKDYEVRTVTINSDCVQLIKMLQLEKAKEAERLGTQWYNEGWLFTQWNGKIMNPQTPTKQFSKFLEKNGLRHRKFHSLRHTSATLLLYGGVNVKQVQSRLGHGDLETTNKYLHYLEEADVQASNILHDMLTISPASNTKKQA